MLLRREHIADSTHLWENSTVSLRCTSMGSAIGTHAGPGAIAAAFFWKESR